MRYLSVLLLAGLVASAATVAAAPDLTFMSTQMRPITEAEWVRTVLLPPFTTETGVPVVFLGAEEPELTNRILAEFEAGRGSLDLVGDLHGNFLVYYGALKDLGAELAQLEALGDRTLAQSFVELGRIGDAQVYIPWMQATYVLVANKKALQYLPSWADPTTLTYDQLYLWAKKIYEATGEQKLGIPAGPRALLHRFLHGYLYPSFTGAQVKKFDSPAAVLMWEYLKDLWQYVTPSAPLLDSMDTALLSEEVWIAWDHTARVKTAVMERPDDFVVLPAPAGPKGRGVITVLAGLAIPQTAPDPASAYQLIEYLTRPSSQVAILEGVGFFPVVTEAAGAVPTGGLKVLADGVAVQSASPDLLVSIIPGGLGARGGEFNKVYLDSFTEIVIRGRPIKEVLAQQGALLDALFRETGAPTPVPDVYLP
ncbi:MAG: ABC transporter substrate-binding protein [Candidatus Bipolaricaulota bacterium]|nr:ABC transporter substrate-binding protein [Candidatus Bipolaricaulota bacterium]